MTVRRTRGRGLTRVCCSSLEALNAYHPLFVCTSQFSPRTDKDEGTNTPAHLFLGRSRFPSMLERSMAACLKVLFLLFLSLSFSLSLITSSEVHLLLLPPFMVVLGKVQPDCLDRVLEERRKRKGLQRFSSTLIAFLFLPSILPTTYLSIKCSILLLLSATKKKYLHHFFFMMPQLQPSTLPKRQTNTCFVFFRG